MFALVLRLWIATDDRILSHANSKFKQIQAVIAYSLPIDLHPAAQHS